MAVPLQLRIGLTNHELSYHLPVAATSCARLESPTIRDLLQDVGPDHDDLCGCGIEVGSRVWIAQCTPGANTEGIDTSSLPTCQLDDTLDQLSYLVDENPRACHLLIEGIGTAVREEKPVEPVVIRKAYGAVFHDGQSAELHLSAEVDTDYAAACAVRGNLLVDKSGYIRVGRVSGCDGWLPTIRRPTGFGKTMFLSLVEHYVDVSSKDSPAPFPSAHFRVGCDFERILPRHALLVLHMDLYELPALQATSDTELRTLCRELLNSCAARCHERYLDRFSGGKENTPGAFSLSTLLKLVEDHDIKLFVGVDNYTSPFAAPLPSDTVEAALVEEIFDPIFDAYNSGLISGGLMVGCELPHLQWPCRNHPSFAAGSVEMSHESIALHILGMDEHEILVMGRALFGDGAGDAFLQQVRMAASCPTSRLTLPAHYGDSYCTRDVLALARALQRSWSSRAANTLRIASVSSEDYPDPLYSVALDDWPSDLRGASAISDEAVMTDWRKAVAAEIAYCTGVATPKQTPMTDAASDDGLVPSHTTLGPRNPATHSSS